MELSTIQSGNRLVRISRAGHLHEGKPARFARITVGHDTYAIDRTISCEQLAQQHPKLQVEANPIFINDGPVWTSAGVTAGIDLALAMVEDDLGRDMALDVARQLVVFLKRPGGQSQFSVTLSLQKQGNRFDDLHAWIAEHLTCDLGIPTLAEQAGMSERSFVRHYRADTEQ